ELRELGLQNRSAAGVLVAQVDVSCLDTDLPRSDQHAFEKAMWIALEVIAVLEGARFALVDVDGEQTRCSFGANDLPLATSWKSCAAEAAQLRALQRSDDPFSAVLAGDAIGQEAITTVCVVASVVDIVGFRGFQFPRFDCGFYRCDVGAIDRATPNANRRRAI